MYLLVSGVAEYTISKYIQSLGKPVPVRYVEIGNGTATFLGDTHGALDVSSYAISNRRDSSAICFLGDLVDRGKDQLLNLLLVLESSILSGRIIITRGNHETRNMNLKYGFVRELSYSGVYDRLYSRILELYDCLPYAVVVNRKVLGLHGGLPRQCTDLEEMDSLQMPDRDLSQSCAFEMLWNDPSPEGNGFGESVRGNGAYTFGKDVARRFLDRNDLIMIVRGHQVVMEGYRKMWDGILTTVFSSRYHGGEAAIMDVKFNGSLETTFETVPVSDQHREGPV